MSLSMFHVWNCFKDVLFTHVPSSLTYTSLGQYTGLSLPLPASYKHGVSRVYEWPRPLRPAGGNTLNDITATRTHWSRDDPHLPNRLPVKWRQARTVPYTFSGLGGAERLATSEPVGCYAVIGWKSGESERLLLRENGARESGSDASAATDKSYPTLKKTFQHASMAVFPLFEWVCCPCLKNITNLNTLDNMLVKKSIVSRIAVLYSCCTGSYLGKQKVWCIIIVCLGMALVLSIMVNILLFRRGGGICAFLLAFCVLLPPLDPPSYCSYGSQSSYWIL